MDTARDVHLERKPRRRGAVVVLVTASMVTLLVFASLAVDVGYICALTGEAQDNADAGCLAGASAIHQGDYDSVKARALDLIGRNQKRQGFHALEDQIVEVGRWDKATSTFDSMDFSLADKANAVRVVAVRNKVSLFFASVMGHHSTDVRREAIAMVAPTCGGVWGIKDVYVGGNVRVDSYDSTEGEYSVGSADNNGDVCSNGPLRVAGSIEIYGDTLGDPVEIDGGKAYVDGNIDILHSPVEIAAIDFGDVATNNDNETIGLTDNGFDPVVGQTLNVPANDNLTLAPGTYFFDSIDFEVAKGKKVPGSISVKGPTKIYLNGTFGATAQGTINTTNDPHDFTLISSGPSLAIVGGSTFYGSIFAPNATILLAGNADVYGAMIGSEVQMTGAFQFHVDESLPLVHSLKSAPMLVK